MDIQSNIASCIKKYRKELGLSQEQLAVKLDVTSQAVSKWECMQSIPDVDYIVKMAELFGVSTDCLLLGKEPSAEPSAEPTDCEAAEGHFSRQNGNRYYFDALPDDSDLRILQFCGRELLREDRYDPEAVIMLEIPAEQRDEKELRLHVIGNLELSGNVENLTCQGDVDCGNVENLTCQGDVDCGNVENLACQGDVDCGNVENLNCQGGVDCGNVEIIHSCGRDISCGDVKEIRDCHGNIECQNVGVIGHCEGDIYCDSMGNEDCDEDCGTRRVHIHMDGNTEEAEKIMKAAQKTVNEAMRAVADAMESLEDK